MRKIKEVSVIFKNSKGEKLWGALSYPAKREKVPAIIISHGFCGTKSARKFVKIGRKFSQQGIAVLRFDFSGCGDSEGNFSKMSISQEIEDLKAAYNFLIKQSQVDKKRIGALGHSLGALIVSLFQLKKSVLNTLVLVAPAINQEDLIKIWYSPQEIKRWREKGYLDTLNFRIGLQYLTEAKNYNSLVSKIKVPVLIIHGMKDEDVPLIFSKKLLKLLGGEIKIIEIDEANHDFESYQTSNALTRHSLKWFRKYL